MIMTAVEWYSNKLVEILGDMCNEFTQEQTLANHYALKQAKEMEKLQAERSYSKEEVDDLLDRLLEGNMCSVVGEELIEKFKKV
jgi:cell division protein FtsB